MISKRNSLIIMLALGVVQCLGQCLPKASIWDSILSVEKNAYRNIPESKDRLLKLKKAFEHCGYQEDSVYARLLHRLGAVCYRENNNIATSEAIEYTLGAIAINSSGTNGAAPDYLVNNYYNAGVFYQSIKRNHKAGLYYDSTILADAKWGTESPFALRSGIRRAIIFSEDGEYGKSIAECSRSLRNAKLARDTAIQMSLLNIQAQSLLYLRQYAEALDTLKKAEEYADILQDDFEKANALKTRARILDGQGKDEAAIDLFKKAIEVRLRTGEYFQIADDFIDVGTFYLERKQYAKSKQCYFEAIRFASINNNKDQLAKAWNNLCAAQLEENRNYAAAEKYLNNSLQQMGLKSIYEDIQLDDFSMVNNNDLLLSLLKTRTTLFRRLYKENGDPQLLNECLKAALLTDSLLTKMRFEHTEEQSKLYWRNLTRDFFATALEACYLAGNMEYAFYFMEKSRAVLLYDKINELAATAKLPQGETEKEQNYKYRIIAVQQQINDGINLRENQLALIRLKDSLERHIKLLELKYPEYYQIKYAGSIPTLQSFQQFLSKKKEVFIHYFFQDTTIYAMTIDPVKAVMLTLQCKAEDIEHFLQLCSNKQRLNGSYASFAELAEKLHSQLFNPLKPGYNRIIICTDNYLLPFEALCSDTEGKDFLVYHYSFSYAYSASSLMHKSKEYRKKSQGIFVGFAPVSFSSRLNLPDLKQSGNWLRNLCSFYKSYAVFTNGESTKRNFINNVSDYSVVNVFSHAIADTGMSEPILFMQDSAIDLRELQVIDRSAAQLIMLSACQTNVGRNETGEGIYSLSRGFSAIGIPSVTSTLWTADEEAVYRISAKFHEYLTKGMSKDEALQKAKLDFMNAGRLTNRLPYYWANMVVIGNSESIDFSEFSEGAGIDRLIVLLLLAGGLLTYYRIVKIINV